MGYQLEIKLPECVIDADRDVLKYKNLIRSLRAAPSEQDGEYQVLDQSSWLDNNNAIRTSKDYLSREDYLSIPTYQGYWIYYDMTRRLIISHPTSRFIFYNSSSRSFNESFQIVTIVCDVVDACVNITFNLTVQNSIPTRVKKKIQQQLDEKYPVLYCDTAFSFRIQTGTFADLDNDNLKYTLTSDFGETVLHTWVNFDQNSLTISGVPPSSFIGNKIYFKLKVQDSVQFLEERFQIPVLPSLQYTITLITKILCTLLLSLDLAACSRVGRGDEIFRLAQLSLPQQ